MVIKLNNTTSIQLCDAKVKWALNALSFEADSDWVIEKFDTRYSYSTLHCRKYGDYSMYDNPKDAIQQTILNALKRGKQPNKKLQDVYFTVIYTEPKPEKIPPVNPKYISQFETDEQRYDFNVWLEHYHIIGKGVDYHSQKKKQRHKKYVIVKDEENKCVNLYVNTSVFNEWLNKKIKEFKETN